MNEDIDFDFTTIDLDVKILAFKEMFPGYNDINGSYVYDNSLYAAARNVCYWTFRYTPLEFKALKYIEKFR